MFKKRRQRSKKYTLTSFGSVDEDSHRDSQEEDGVFPGSESEFDDEGFSAAPDPTWDSDYLDMLEKRATAGSEGREDQAEDAVSPGLSDTAGKGAQLFEQQRKRATEHSKKAEEAQPQVCLQPDVLGQVQSQTQPSFNLQSVVQTSPMATQQKPSHIPEAHDVQMEHISMSPPLVAPKPATASVTLLTTPAPPAETPSEISASNVLNRTARPFTPGFIAVRSATAPVTFRPPVTKTTQRPSSTAVVLPPFSTGAEQTLNTPSSLPPQLQSGPPPVVYSPPPVPPTPLVPASAAPGSFHAPAVSRSVEKMPPPMTSVHQAPFSSAPANVPSVPLASQPPVATTSIPGLGDQHAPLSPPHVAAVQSPPPKSPLMFVSSVSVVPQSEAAAPTAVPGPTGRTGILLEARRRSGKPKPMFNVPEVAKKSPNPDLLCMVQKMDDRFVRQKPGQPVCDTVSDGGEETRRWEMGRAPPPVAPKPKVVQETPQFLQAGGKGAELFARRQTRMGMYVVDTPPETPHEHNVASHSTAHLHDLSLSPSSPSQWKLSPNVRAPPPIGYNPLMAPSIPTGPQRGTTKPNQGGRGGSQRDGIKAIDFMRRQPYQLNPAMFNYGGSATNLSSAPSYQRQQQRDYTMVGSSLASPKQIPIKTARVYEVKRFSTPTPMSAPTLAPKVIAPRSATTLGERLTHSQMVSPPLAPITLEAAPAFSNTMLTSPKPAGLPTLPKFSSTSVPNPVPHSVPTPYTPVSFNTGLQTAKQFQSAPELSVLASLPPLKSNCIQAPKPRFVATKGGVQPHIWRPGAM